MDGRALERAGAALAGGMTIDSFDSTTATRSTKGHAGAAVLPACWPGRPADGPLRGASCSTALVIGYEVAIRAGIALHANGLPITIPPGPGTPSAARRWLRVCWRLRRRATATCARHRQISRPAQPDDALHRPPTMLKDGSGWGAMAGVSAAHLARDGFTGAPACVEGGAVAAPLGRSWPPLAHRCEMYFKPYPICRWAQPAVEGALALPRRAARHRPGRPLKRSKSILLPSMSGAT